MPSHLQGRILGPSVTQPSESHRRTKSDRLTESRELTRPDDSRERRVVSGQTQRAQRSHNPGAPQKTRKHGRLTSTEYFRMRLKQKLKDRRINDVLARPGKRSRDRKFETTPPPAGKRTRIIGEENRHAMTDIRRSPEHESASTRDNDDFLLINGDSQAADPGPTDLIPEYETPPAADGSEVLPDSSDTDHDSEATVMALLDYPDSGLNNISPNIFFAIENENGMNIPDDGGDHAAGVPLNFPPQKRHMFRSSEDEASLNEAMLQEQMEQMQEWAELFNQRHFGTNGDGDIAMASNEVIVNNEDEVVERASDRGVADDHLTHIEDEDEFDSPESGTDDSLEDEDALLAPPLSLRGNSSESGAVDKDKDTTLRERAQANQLRALLDGNDPAGEAGNGNDPEGEGGMQGGASRGITALYDDLIGSEPAATATRGDMALLISHLHDLVDVLERQTRRDVHENGRYDKAATRDREKNPHRPPDKIQLNANVREFAARLLGRPEKDSPFPNGIASAEEVLRFAESKRDGPTVENFRLDLDTNALASDWNKQAAKVFTREFVRRNWYACKDEKAIRKAFLTHLITLRSHYLHQKDADQEPTIEQLDEQKARAREQRRRGLYKRRLRASKIHPSLAPFRQLFESLSFEAMSGDETDHISGKRRYAITTLPWRSQEVRDWLKTFDHLYLSTRFTINDRAKKGPFPHPRVLSRRVERYWKAPRGLPLNFYNPKWLDSLEDIEREDLDIQPIMDLTLASSMRRLAARFKGVTSRISRPLPRNHPSLPQD